MADVTVTVKSGDAGRAGWRVHHFRWDGPDGPRPEIQSVRFEEEDDGKFVGVIDVADGSVHCLTVHVTLGAELEIDITPRWKVVQTRGETWPAKVAVSSIRTQRLKTFYFRSGEDQ